jgi:hypothetical protein
LPNVAARTIVGSQPLGRNGVIAMQAKVGDRLVVEGHTVGSGRREGEILEVRGDDGTPPYVVRWDDGHEGLTFPGADAHCDPTD